MSTPGCRFHVEFPTEMPLEEPFELQGWLASDAPVSAIASGAAPGGWLTLFDRPDVRQAHPELRHAVGFRGSAGFSALRDGTLTFEATLGGAPVRFTHRPAAIEFPPDALQIRQVGGVWGAGFFRAGAHMLEEIRTAFEGGGVPFGDTGRILDFGCGCGRVLRSFKRLPHRAEVWGCDIDAEAIAWNRGHLADIARFDCNGAMPPLAFPDAFFDVIYSVSVFTHLPEDMQLAWLAELRRVLKPGGALLASIHGERYWTVDPGVQAEVRQSGFAYRTGTVTAGLPEFYMTAFHSHDYVRSVWARFFTIAEIKTSYIHGVHDAVLARRPA